MNIIDYRPFAPSLPAGRARALPWSMVLGGSLLTAIIPVVASLALMPPLGLIMLLTWRLLARFALRPWAAAPLGLADDLVSGQPIGSAVLVWSLCFLAIEMIEQRLVSRDFGQDWLIASGAIAFCLVVGRWIALPIRASVDATLIAQIMVAVMLFPLSARIVAWVDRKRGTAV